MRIFNTERNHWFNYGVNANVQHNFNEKTSLTFNANYILYRNTQPVENEISFVKFEKVYLIPVFKLTFELILREMSAAPTQVWMGVVLSLLVLSL